VQLHISVKIQKKDLQKSRDRDYLNYLEIKNEKENERKART